MTDGLTDDERGKKYLEQAYQELASGDLCQASEKGWGATAQLIKAIASRRDWRHSSHAHLNMTITQLAIETDRDDLLTSYHNASALHQNFYEGYMSRKQVEVGLGRVHTKRSASKMSANEMNPRKITSSFSKREKMRRNPFNRRNSLSISLRLLYISRSYSHG